uniref:Uncharacterized protein n=1 Tax=Oryza meridionalis TaxID=40149 RepID=A0A0E0ERZ4_9ORYZ
MGCVGEVTAGEAPRAAANGVMVETRLRMETHTPPRFLHHDLQRHEVEDRDLHRLIFSPTVAADNATPSAGARYLCAIVHKPK